MHSRNKIVILNSSILSEEYALNKKGVHAEPLFITHSNYLLIR
jgi:hypothetical protein